MSRKIDYPPDEESLLFDREDLASDIEWILKGDSHSPEILARLFVSFRQAIDSGLQGINHTRKALVTAIELVYLHSRAHVSALKLYRLSLEGELKIQDEPVNLINAAIERSSRAGARKGQGPGHARKKAGDKNLH
jgi:hypothetical protein